MTDLDMIRIVDVDYIENYTLLLTFSNGERRVVDCLPLLKTKMHEPLKNMDNFIQFGLTHWTLQWYNGVDFAPDYLYEHSVPAYDVPNDSDGGMVAEEIK